MAFEQTVNIVNTTLASGYTSSSGTLSVTSATGMPSTGNFRLVLDPGGANVLWKCTSRSGTTLTGTAEASDTNVASGKAVSVVITAGALDAIRGDLVQSGTLASAVVNRNGNLYFPTDGTALLRDTGSAFEGFGPFNKFTDPALQSFTDVNMSGVATDTSHGGIAILNVNSEMNFHIHAKVKAAPSTPYHIEVACLIQQHVNTNCMAGLLFSDGTKFMIFTPAFQNTLCTAVIFYCTNTTTYGSSNPLNTGAQVVKGVLWWIRIGDDGTNRTYDLSFDGYTWYPFYSETRATNFTATEVGFFVNSGPAGMRVLSWKETT